MKKQEWWFLFIAGVLLVLFLATRLIRLALIPIFTDEAIYLRWAQIASFDPAWRFISLTDGKQPLFIWLTMVALRFFKDPLLAGRLVSVFAGLGTMAGLFFLAKELFKEEKIGLLAAGLYLLYPFALVYDRLALMEGLLGMFAVWALYLEVLLIRTFRLDAALILGMVIGGSILTKSSGSFNLYLLPFSLLLFPWEKKKKAKRLFWWLGLALIAVVVSQAIYAVLRLSPLFHIIAEKNAVFIYPFKEWLDHPFRFLIGNLRGLWDWLVGYFSWPMMILLIFSLVSFWHYFKEKALLLIWFAAPFFALALFGKVLYPRFIFSMTLSLLPLLALVLYQLYRWLRKPLFFVFCFLFFVFFWVRTDWELLTDPFLANIPNSDKAQYLNDWPAGGGIKEAVAFFHQRAKEQKIYVATEGTFGLLPYALEIYLSGNPQVEIHGFWPLQEKMPAEVSEKANLMLTYFVFNQSQKPPERWPLKPIARYRKGIGEAYLSVYQVVVEEQAR